jgi:hypothetical protein
MKWCRWKGRKNGAEKRMGKVKWKDVRIKRRKN